MADDAGLGMKARPKTPHMRQTAEAGPAVYIICSAGILP
jgi:hypothetical protein